MDCLFCKIINKEIPADILYEDEDIIAIMDKYPHCEGHTLVIPKKHFTDLYEVDNDTLNKMFTVARNINKNNMTKLGQDKASFVFNYGESQAIKHLHLHVINTIDKQENQRPEEVIYEIIK